MHIMEGYLPNPWWEIWYILSFPVVAFGIHSLGKLIREKREILPLLAVAGAFIFVLSSLKLPSVSGSCSHLTGTGLSSIIFGPAVTAVLSTIVLVYQAFFLAHGGLTTLGANIFSMGIAGPVVGFAIYKLATKLGLNLYLSVFLAATFADLTTYVTTSFQLALAFPASSGGVQTSFIAFAAIFALTQVPLAILEGVVAALMFKYILQVRSDVLFELNVISPKAFNELKNEISV